MSALGDDRDGLDVESEVQAAASDLKGRAATLTSSERPALIEAMGGVLGMIESSVPSVAFVIAVTAGAETKTGAIIAIAMAALFGIARAVRKQTIQFAVTGVVGVAISAYVASKTGEARNFFLPGFLTNVAYGTIAFVSVAIGRPFVGYIVEGLAGGHGNWREDPIKMRKFRTASLLWGGLFVLRLVVQLPLYFSDHLVALGTAKIAMSYPLFGIGIWLTWLLVRAPSGAEDEAKPEPAAT